MSFNGLDPFKYILNKKKITKTRMAKMWCELNTYKVPKEFEKELLPFSFGSSNRAIIAMKNIESIIGRELCLKHWRKNIVRN